MACARLEPGTGAGREPACTGAEDMQILCIAQIQQAGGCGIHGIAVEADQRGAAGQSTEVPVPHHPTTGAVVEHALTPAQVAVQQQFLLVLQQQAAR